MKKRITIAIAVFALTFSAKAQETETTEILVSKKGTPILPQKGDFGIGVDAEPFLTYLGNVFGKTTTNNAPQFNTKGNGTTITGKYFINKNTAYRAAVRVGVTSTNNETILRDDDAYSSDTNTKATVTDIKKINGSDIFIGLGLEKRRGYGRLQGIYGFMGSIGSQTNTTTIEHGNPITITNKYPTRSTTYTEIKSGSVFSIGASGFVGVEYFIAPKLSLGGEFSYGLFYSNNGNDSIDRESWDSDSNSVITNTTESGGGSTFNLDNSISSLITMHFYF